MFAVQCQDKGMTANGMDRLLPQSQQVSLLRLYLLTIGAASHGKHHKN